jgi:hypothetical protein
MRSFAAWFFLLTLGALIGGCAQKQEPVAMHGNADSVTINYVGELADTLPVARRHCAQYEKVPVLRANKDNYVTYACVKNNPAPGTPS